MPEHENMFFAAAPLNTASQRLLGVALTTWQGVCLVWCQYSVFTSAHISCTGHVCFLSFQFTNIFPQAFRPEPWLKNAQRNVRAKVFLAAVVVFCLTTWVLLRHGQNSSKGQFRQRTKLLDLKLQMRAENAWKILFTLWKINKNICVLASLVPFHICLNCCCHRATTTSTTVISN